jgi:outer membrane protein, heavy metal efflux system
LEAAAQARYRAGAVTQQDVIRTQIRMTHLVHRSIVLDRDRKVAEARLNEVLGRTARAGLARPENSPQVADSRQLENLLRTSIENRPELRMLEEVIRGNVARLKLADMDYYPDFTAGASYVDIEGGSNSTFGSDGDDAFKLMFGVTLPIYSRRRSAAVREAEAGIEEARARYLAMRNRIDRQVRVAFEEMTEAQQEVTLFTDTLLPQTALNIEAAQSGYKAAQVDLLTVIDAQKALEDVELAHQRALQDLSVAVEELRWAVGSSLGTSSTRDGSRR